MTPDFPPRLLDRASTEEEQAGAALLSRLPALAADDHAAARIWRGMDRPPRLNRARRVLAGAMLAAAAVVVFAVVRRPPASPSAELLLSSGQVLTSAGSSKWRAVSEGAAVAPGTRVRAEATGRAILRIDEVATVLVGPASEVSLQQVAHGTVIRLVHGAVTSRVLPRPVDEPYVVATDRYTVRVVGTLFTVVEQEGGAISVSVRRGLVEVLDRDQVIAHVGAGQRWSSATGLLDADTTSEFVQGLLEDALRTGTRPPSRERLSALSLPEPLAPALPAEHVVAPPAPELATHVVSPPTLRLLPSEARESRIQPVSPTPLPPITVPGGRDPTPPPATPPALPAVAMSIPLPDAIPVAPLPVAEAPPVASPARPVIDPPRAPTPAAASVPDAYDAAQTLLAKGAYAEAARQFEIASEQQQDRAATALYQLGLISLNRLHDPARAVKAFGTYRLRFSHGPLLPEVDWGSFKAEVASRHEELALQEAARFLELHPNDEHVQDVHLTRADLHRQRKELADAIRDYQAITRPSLADDALWSLAWCQRESGDTAAAAATLRQYLEQLPNGKHRDDARVALGAK